MSTCHLPKASRCCNNNDSSDDEISDSDTECCQNCCKSFKCCSFSKTRSVQISTPKEEETTGEVIAEMTDAPQPLRSAPSVEIIGMRNIIKFN